MEVQNCGVVIPIFWEPRIVSKQNSCYCFSYADVGVFCTERNWWNKNQMASSLGKHLLAFQCTAFTLEQLESWITWCHVKAELQINSAHCEFQNIFQGNSTYAHRRSLEFPLWQLKISLDTYFAFPLPAAASANPVVVFSIHPYATARKSSVGSRVFVLQVTLLEMPTKST